MPVLASHPHHCACGNLSNHKAANGWVCERCAALEAVRYRQSKVGVRQQWDSKLWQACESIDRAFRKWAKRRDIRYEFGGGRIYSNNHTTTTNQ